MIHLIPLGHRFITKIQFQLLLYRAREIDIIK